MATPPGSPTALETVSQPSTIDLSWTAPASTGGDPILGYNVYQGTTSGAEWSTCQTVADTYATCAVLAADVATCADLWHAPVNSSLVTGTAYTATGLTDSTVYYFTVVAVNAAGPSFPSAETSATPGAPAAPTIGTATPGDAQATVTWTAPPADGAPAITGYTVTANPGGVTATAGPTDTSVAVTGLTNFETYTFTVTATNSVGVGVPSQPSNTVSLNPPPAPIIGTATAGNTQATVTWTAPPADNTPTISGYTVTSNPGAVTASTGPTSTTATVTGLTNFETYDFTVTATNSVGTGLPSLPSNSVIPESQPGAPSVTAVATTDPLSGDPTVTITVTADTTAAPDGVTMGATLLRNDGTYVIGASPTNALPIPLGPNTATVIDRQAPYGVDVSYTAIVTFAFFSDGAPLVTPPSMPSTPVTMGQAPDTNTLHARTGWAADQDVTGTLRQWLAGIGQMMQVVDSISRDGYDTDGNPAPGWSQLLDINRAPTFALPWFGQFVGARFDTSIRDDQQRYIIEHARGFARGTPAAIIAAANQYLLPGYTVTLAERDSSAYHLTVSVPTAGIAGTSTCESLMLGYATCALLESAFATCADLWGASGAVLAAVKAAVPGALVATVNFD